MTTPNFNKGNGLLPAIIQDENSGKVLMLGYMNEEALRLTERTKKVTFYSRSRQKLWVKGETSGNFIDVKKIYYDCDGDCILVMGNPHGPTCHKGTISCFGDVGDSSYQFLSKLENVITKKRDSPDDKSYTSSLFLRGINKIAQKVGEEAVEVIIEAKDNDKGKFLGESADLIYHFMVLLNAKGCKFSEVVEILKERHKIK